MTTPRRLAVLFGGRSGEHEVSVMSARSIISAVDRERYSILPIAITPDGRWWLSPDPAPAFESGRVGEEGEPIALVPGSGSFVQLSGSVITPVDVAFPVLHGPHGEDGTVQGLLELARIPYVGAGVLGSAAGMDKIIMKQLFRVHGLPIADFSGLARHEWERGPDAVCSRIEEAIGYPCFVKPANLGSSVGISRAAGRDGLIRAIDSACLYDSRIIVECAVSGRELECSVLGNMTPRASVVGEIRPGREFYDYRAKYVDDCSELIIPAVLEQSVSDRVRELAVAAFQAIDCAGMARVDFFLSSDGEVLVNEINTIPGFTRISLYPKLWEATGLPWPRLIDSLVELALERHADRERNRHACCPDV